MKKGKWRVYINFRDLNKACLKDSFPLPMINQLVDAIVGYQFLSFMDVYSIYNKIPMSKDDQEAMPFIIDSGTYCYKIMPFRLKNVGATY